MSGSGEYPLPSYILLTSYCVLLWRRAERGSKLSPDGCFLAKIVLGFIFCCSLKITLCRNVSKKGFSVSKFFRFFPLV